MSGRLDVAAVVASWRGLLAVLAPQISAIRVDERAHATVAAITAQLDPSTYRAVGEAFLIELHQATTAPGSWRFGVTPEHLVRALVGLDLIDRAFAAAVAPGASP